MCLSLPMPAALQGGLSFLQKARKCPSITMAERFQVGDVEGQRVCKASLQAVPAQAVLRSGTAHCCSVFHVPTAHVPISMQ